MLVIGLVLWQSVMAISTVDILLYAQSIFPLCITGVHCCLHANNIVYKHFDSSLHIRSLDQICVQSVRPVPLTVFEILGFKLKKKNWRNGVVAISPMFVVQFSPNFR